jgi:hypothetical protein
MERRKRSVDERQTHVLADWQKIVSCTFCVIICIMPFAATFAAYMLGELLGANMTISFHI